MSASEVHNRATKAALNALVAPIMMAGGTSTDLLIATESLVVGVFLACVKLGGDEPVLDVFADGLRQRLAELRLGGLPPEGTS